VKTSSKKRGKKKRESAFDLKRGGYGAQGGGKIWINPVTEKCMEKEGVEMEATRKILTDRRKFERKMDREHTPLTLEASRWREGNPPPNVY